MNKELYALTACKTVLIRTKESQITNFINSHVFCLSQSQCFTVGNKEE